MQSPCDLYAGERLREQRKELDLTQDALADMLEHPVTFQQIQKYERGRNRMSASTLWQIAQVLDLPPEYFFPPFDDDSARCTNAQEVKLLEQYRLLTANKKQAFLDLLMPEGK